MTVSTKLAFSVIEANRITSLIQNDLMFEMEGFDCDVSKVVWVMIAINSLVVVLF